MTTKQYAEGLWLALAETNPASHDAVINQFLEILNKDGKLELYPDIITEIEALAQIANQKPPEVTFAKEDSGSKQILDKINKIVNSKSDLKVKIDENIIGGVILKTGDQLLDASIKTQLDELNKHLIN